MPILLLFRAKPLDREEKNRLPIGCFAVSPDDGDFTSKNIVAKAQLKAPLPMMLKMAVAMGRAVPDAVFGYEEGFAYQQATATASSQSTRAEEHEDTALEAYPQSSDDAMDDSIEDSIEDAVLIDEDSSSEAEQLKKPKSWSELLHEGEAEEALEAVAQALEQKKWTVQDRLLLNQCFASKRAEEMIFVCRAAIRFQWRTMALKLRSGLRHEEPQVRIAVLQAIGVLAGPSLSPSVQLLTADSDESVKKEAIKALKRLKKNSAGSR